MEKEFEKNLISEGYTFRKYQRGYYEVYNRHRIQPCIRVQLIPSKPINKMIHGSQNGLEIQGIGIFHINIEDSLFDPEVIALSFQNTITIGYEYMIIPTKELLRRLKKNMIRYRGGEHIELRLWLMDGGVYNCSSMSLESEWFYLSKGRGGRMIDSTIWNFTGFWNNWVLGSLE
jgi:hypothetical protein